MRNVRLAAVWPLSLLCIVLSPLCSAQTPAAELAIPPIGARHYIIESTGGKHGDAYQWLSSDGMRMARESMNVRGKVWETEMRARIGADGLPTRMTIRGMSPQGDAAESFAVESGTATWRSQIDGGSSTNAAQHFYLPQGGPFDSSAWLLERLLATSDHTLALLPAGKASATSLRTLDVQGAGGAHESVTLWAITGVMTQPVPVWADSHDRFFAFTSSLGWLPEAYAGEQQKLEVAQAEALSAMTATLARNLVKKPVGPIAFVDVQLFDADRLQFVRNQTVVVDGADIVAVGPVGTTRVPPRTTVVQGKGMTLLPGLWDCHMHVSDDFTGVQELSLGVTSIRDPGNNDALTMNRRTRRAAGTLLMPHVHASSLIDGKGPYTAQIANVATSQAEAIELVQKAKANGFTGVKFYGTFDPAWLAASTAEAHQLGLHVHGHVPAGIRPMDAIARGYDEITHINWIIMQAAPDDVIAVSNGTMRFEWPGRFAKNVDLDGPAMRPLITTMAQKKIYSDPTMVAFESLYVPENGDLSPSVAPFAGTLPPAAERGFREGGIAVPKDLTRAHYRASWAKMVALLGKMHKAGVPIVAGTDGSGIELVHDLEIYVDAGMTPAEAIAAATIVPARLVGESQRTGSSKVGKAADLVLVEGDPSKRIGDLRQTRTVLMDGVMFDADTLRAAAGFSGRPK